MREATHEAADAIFRLEQRGEDGVSRRAKLEKVAAKGPRAKSLDVEIPKGALDAWELWLDLNNGRSVGFGISTLSWLDIEAWSRIRDRKLTHTELELIRTIDRAFVQVQNAKESK